MVRLIWTELASSELKEIYDYISNDSKLYAKRQVIRIRQKTMKLKTSKYIGRQVEEIGIPTIRELIEGNYRIIYKVMNDHEVAILTIHHSSRDLTTRKIE
ncbi:MAG: type II toxin-antitoxin system RelE/ParE family toxin [Saprospiraceae bacterium]|uniref:Type II toxin-antitoxin system RelE/ParE family toxin n=1 Tax=Candidatus Opimibacter skivensis TaxID=2982028 RepID=A0A9D7XSW4_9BACT|nr:type II toxin-antitoxin system RelE/ParE family toxin [Candidatus Opimibacter skivensis]